MSWGMEDETFGNEVVSEEKMTEKCGSLTINKN